MSSVILPGDRLAAVECQLHFVRYARAGESHDGFPDPDAGVRELQKTLPRDLTASYAVPLAAELLLGLHWRAVVLLAWFAFNNFVGRTAFVVLIRNSAGDLVHRSTVVKNDPRKPYSGCGFEVTQVWTDEACRGRGLATQVMQSLMDAAPEVQIHWMVREGNAASIAVVTRLGFKCAESFSIRRRMGIRTASHRTA